MSSRPVIWLSIPFVLVSSFLIRKTWNILFKFSFPHTLPLCASLCADDFIVLFLFLHFSFFIFYNFGSISSSWSFSFFFLFSGLASDFFFHLSKTVRKILFISTPVHKIQILVIIELAWVLHDFYTVELNPWGRYLFTC